MIPISKARNLGPISERECARIGIRSLEELRDIGWEEAFLRLVEVFPERINLNAAAALIGALDDVDWREINPEAKKAARRLIGKLRKTQHEVLKQERASTCLTDSRLGLRPE